MRRSSLEGNKSDIGRLVHDILDTGHRQRKASCVERSQSDVDVDDGHDEIRRDGEGPPSIRIVIDA